MARVGGSTVHAHATQVTPDEQLQIDLFVAPGDEGKLLQARADYAARLGAADQQRAQELQLQLPHASGEHRATLQQQAELIAKAQGMNPEERLHLELFFAQGEPEAQRRAVNAYVGRLALMAQGNDAHAAAWGQQKLTDLRNFFEGLARKPSLPVNTEFRIIGRPGQGTHSFSEGPNNWESDNALDFSVPIGTPILAVADGVVKGVGGTWNGGADRFDGKRLTLTGADNAWWFGHLSEVTVQEGQHVKKGDIIGYSGAGNGAPHLHIGQQHGNPSETFGV